MLNGKRILAVVPARSGSKGIPNKNMQMLRGTSLIGWAGLTLGQLPFLDARVISTDSMAYTEEGQKYGLAAPFLRPPELSTDEAGATGVVQHALLESEKYYSVRFDIVLIVEPTSPLRTPEDIRRVTLRLTETGTDSVIAVSPLSIKFHPLKILTVQNGMADFLENEGKQIVNRQELSDSLFWRNGICYALTRSCLMEQGKIFTDRTLLDVISRPVVNIDEPFELDWAEFLLTRHPPKWLPS